MALQYVIDVGAQSTLILCPNSINKGSYEAHVSSAMSPTLHCRVMDLGSLLSEVVHREVCHIADDFAVTKM